MDSRLYSQSNWQEDFGDLVEEFSSGVDRRETAGGPTRLVRHSRILRKACVGWWMTIAKLGILANARKYYLMGLAYESPSRISMSIIQGFIC